MKRMSIIISILFSNFALAGSGSGEVKIEHVGKWGDKSIVFFYTDEFEDKPECNKYQGRWTINIDTEIGKAQYSLILAAQASGSEVRVNGMNTCNLWFNSEDVHWVGYP